MLSFSTRILKLSALVRLFSDNTLLPDATNFSVFIAIEANNEMKPTPLRAFCLEQKK